MDQMLEFPRLPPLFTCRVAVIGLGYVGLPLAVELARTSACSRTGRLLLREVIGFDTDPQRIKELEKRVDRTQQISPEVLAECPRLELTADPASLNTADVFVIAVPTPVDAEMRPDLSHLENASARVGRALKERVQGQRQIGAAQSLPVVIYESTVFPGATEEFCIPILEQASGLTLNESFVCGYSPERVSPGDKEHRLRSIVKITSGSTSEAAAWVDHFYASIILAGTHPAPSIKVAEAAKVAENIQRDLNIALANELAMIFRQLNIDTLDVLEASRSKWNFLDCRPGLVGGHCISVDPYYLAHRAQLSGHQPQLIAAGRQINASMGAWVAEQLKAEMTRNKIRPAGSEVLVLGFSYKENCPDYRNTQVLVMLQAMERHGMKPIVVDPWVAPEDVMKEYGIEILDKAPPGQIYQAVVCAVSHQEFADLSLDQWKGLVAPDGVFIDVKGIMPRALSPFRV